MRLVTGTRLGPYEVLSSIGAGGMAEVYRARDTRLQRDVAVKVVGGALASDGGFLARLEHEASSVPSGPSESSDTEDDSTPLRAGSTERDQLQVMLIVLEVAVSPSAGSLERTPHWGSAGTPLSPRP